MEDLIKIEEACRQARLAVDNTGKTYVFFYGSADLNFNNRVLSQNPYFTRQRHSKYVYRKTSNRRLRLKTSNLR